METERAYLVEIHSVWIDLRKIELILPGGNSDPERPNKILMDSGISLDMGNEDLQALMDKLASFGMLAG
jgi:hypothetical protein